MEEEEMENVAEKLKDEKGEGKWKRKKLRKEETNW